MIGFYLTLAILGGIYARGNNRVLAAIAGIVGPCLCFFSAATLKGVFLLRGTAKRKGGELILGLLGGAASLVMLWKTGVWIEIGIKINGVVWGLIGGLIGFIFTTKKMVEGPPPDENSAKPPKEIERKSGLSKSDL
jgi:hypothetical protein